MSDRPTLAVGVCLLRPGANGPAHGPEVLLIRRANPPHQGSWSFPGGRQHFGETLEDAARRELLEETALTVGPLTLIAALDVLEGAYHYVVLDYAGWWRGDPARPGDDAAACSWWPVSDLARRPVTQAIRDVAAAAVTILGLR